MNIFVKLNIHVFSNVMIWIDFKQKTAYEMRISDWSSDVCSSDLMPDPSIMKTLILDTVQAETATVKAQCAKQIESERQQSQETVAKWSASHEIGRASCRERVYVLV